MKETDPHAVKALHGSDLSRDTEELVDLYFHRVLATCLVERLLPLPVTSNQVTIASGLAGLAAGVCIALAGPYTLAWVAIGGILVLISVVLDCADGQLARLRGEASLVGRALDGSIDIVPVVSVFVGSALFLVHHGLSPTYVAPVALVAGYSWKRHAAGYDRAKQLYLANTRFDARRDCLPTMEEIEAERQRLLAHGRIVLACAMTIFKVYTKAQQQDSTSGDFGLSRPLMQTDAQRALYRRMFARHMRWWSWNGIGTHHLVIYAAALLTPLWPTALVAAWWIIIIPMNVLHLVTYLWGRRLEDRLASRLG